ncbi:GNAT family acetyltransferase [Bacillus sp. SA1-12]|uniref:GNAT family N-acetyltransferase n=1 Tax=Bacillus sp. SA1-12 TaxID=1455638 RepID=UPI0006257CE9|nr:GNAT family N-acetyltransferase [Bacillus sp. SA1-12]KKI93412.1 GNAT family acetyltransferase [Bacillus sp. SA1-12]
MIEKMFEALDLAYISSFSKRVETSWGYLFYNIDQPNYYDANHAHISAYIRNHEEIIDEVVTFYQEKGLRPRFYLFQYEDHSDFIAALKQRGFGFEEFDCPIQLWKSRVNVKKDTKVTIEKVTEENKQDAMYIECQMEEFGGAIREKAFEVEFAHEAYTHYLLKYDGIPCSTACIFLHEQDARLESVATLEAYRGKGLIGQLIHYIQEEVANLHVDRFWVMPITERVEKVYKKSGFETIKTLKTGHAFLGGKSVGEIRNS